jgi:hypothetical protein
MVGVSRWLLDWFTMGEATGRLISGQFEVWMLRGHQNEERVKPGNAGPVLGKMPVRTPHSMSNARGTPCISKLP